MHPQAKARRDAGMSQALLARKLEIDPSVVRHIEAGRRHPYPRFRRLCAEIFDMTEAELFGEEAANGAGNRGHHRRRHSSVGTHTKGARHEDESHDHGRP